MCAHVSPTCSQMPAMWSVRGELGLQLVTTYPAGPGIIISFIGDWHLNLRQRSWFEPPPFQRVGCHLIENLVACASWHRRTGNSAARGIDDQNANTASSDMGILRLLCIMVKRSSYCCSIVSRQCTWDLVG